MQDGDILELHATVRDYLIPYVTSEWLSFARTFLAEDVAATVEALPPGVSLGEAHPTVWPSQPAVADPGLTPSSPQSAVPSPQTIPPVSRTPSLSQSAAPSPLSIPPVSRTPSLSQSAAPSPLSIPVSRTPSSSSAISSQPPVPLGTELAASSAATPDLGRSVDPTGSAASSQLKRGRTTARAAYRQPKRTHLFIGDPPPSSQASTASAVTASAPAQTSSKKRTKLAMGPRIEGTKSCVGCVLRKSKCAPPLGSYEPYPCAKCIDVGEGHICPNTPESSACFLPPGWRIDFLSFRSFQARDRHFDAVLASPGFDQAGRVVQFCHSCPGYQTVQPWHPTFPCGRRALRRASSRSHSWDRSLAAGGCRPLELRGPGRQSHLRCELARPHCCPYAGQVGLRARL
jgi:hypothetical protein